MRRKIIQGQEKDMQLVRLRKIRQIEVLFMAEEKKKVNGFKKVKFFKGQSDSISYAGVPEWSNGLEVF